MDYFTDKKWMYQYKSKPTRCNPKFVGGVCFFIDYAKQQLAVQGNGVMRCPCWECENNKFLDCETIMTHIVLDCETIMTHIVLNGFVPVYEIWRHHGELPERREIDVPVEIGHNEEMATMLCDAFVRNVEDANMGNDPEDPEFHKFEHLLNGARKPLYGGCHKHSKLSFMVHLFQLKCLNRWSNKSFSDLLSLLKDILPSDNLLPCSWYESKKMMSDLGLNYEKIHACPNDCLLFRNEYKDLDACPRCSQSR